MPLTTDAPFDGRNATIVAAATEVNVVDVPEDRVFKITRFHVSNNNPVATRVRFFDLFTDSDGDVHDSTTNPILLGDFNLQARRVAPAAVGVVGAPPTVEVEGAEPIIPTLLVPNSFDEVNFHLT